MLRGRPTSLLIGAVALAGLATLTACGSSSGASATPTASPSPTGTPNGVQNLSADQILKRTKAAVGAATSVHATGNLPSSGAAITLDMQLASNGDAQGSLTNNGQSVQLVSTGGTVYLSADLSFWTAQAPAVAAQLAGKWVAVPTGAKSFGNVTDYTSFLGQLLTPQGTITKGDQTTVDGMPAITLVDSKNQGQLLVALQGDPLPLKVIGGDGSELALTDWNADFTVTAPPASEVVDPSTLAPVAPSPSTPAPSTSTSP